MPKIIGIKLMCFTPKDGNKVEGAMIYATEPLRGDKASGEEAFSFFLSQAKLDAQTFTLKVGQEVDLLYNRYGKVYRLDLKKQSNDDDTIIDFGDATMH
ncbi:MAG: hypothetical protein E7632_05775 [Ruminococcaceae bacterium]|nr:hypothetical protein [Oscillospiraceae bacterium]